MKNKLIFGKWESVTLLINMICTKVFINFPRTAAEVAGTASWIMTLYIALLAFIFFFVISKLYSRFEGKDILDIGEHAAGSAGRIVTGVIILAYLLFSSSMVIREFTEEMKVIAFTLSPISFISMFFLGCMVVGAYFGLEAIVRFHAFAVPIIAAGYLFILAAVLPFADFSNLIPVLGNGMGHVLGNGFFRVSEFSEFLLLFLIVPFIKTNKNFKKVGYYALGFSAFFLLVSAPIYLATLNYPTALENFIPIYQMARLINYGRFFQRIEPLFMVIWAAAAILYLTTSFYFIVYVFRKAFKLEYQRPLILPFAILVFSISLIPHNLITAVKLEGTDFRNISWVVTFGFTLLLLLVASAVKTKSGKELKR